MTTMYPLHKTCT